LAHFFQEKGLNKGDRVACMLPNSPQSVITYYGALMVGGVVVQVNPLFTERELTHMVEDSGAKFIMCLDILLPRVSNVSENTSLEHVIVTIIADYLPFPKNIVYPFIQKKEYKMVVKIEETEDTHYLKSVVESGSEDYTPIDVDQKEDIALIQYTGETTDNHKEDMFTYYKIVI